MGMMDGVGDSINLLDRCVGEKYDRNIDSMACILAN